MSVTDLFIRRPVMTTLLMTGVLIFGLIAYTRLPVSDLPSVDFPTLSVDASLPGASPETMAATVATPLEKQFSAIAGIDNMTSSSTLGSTSITIQFNLKRNINAAAQDVQAAISQALPNLPSGIITPSYRRQNPAAAPIMLFAVTSATEAMSNVDEVAETTIAQRLSTVNGVAQVAVYGAAKYAVRVQVDPQALAARGLGVDQLSTTIANENVNQPTGVLWGPDKSITVQATGQLQNASQFNNLIVAYKNGAAVHLREVARVTDDVQSNKTAAWFNGDRAIMLFVQRQPGTNTVQVADGVKAALREITPQIPGNVKVNLLYDRTLSIKDAVSDVKFTLVLALVLVVLVIFLFLRNISATAIPSMALPMSILGTFAVMYLLGYSIDNISLLALTLAVGFVVDDAIVMLENIVRHLEMGKPRLQAALEGAKEVQYTIVTMTISLAAVFIPILFMGGIVGQLFHEFAVTIMAAILVSGVVSLTLTPMLCSRFLTSHKDQAHGRLYMATERVFDGALSLYVRSLEWMMLRRPLMLGLTVVVMVAMVQLFGTINKGLFPSDDTGQLNVTTEGQEGISFDAIVPLQKRVAAIVSKDPNVASVMSSVGSQGSANQGRLWVILKPRSQRKPAEEVARGLNRQLQGIAGLQVFVQNPPSLRIGGRQSKSLYQYNLQGGDLATLNRSAQALQAALRKNPKLLGVTTDLQIKNPQLTVTIDRDRAASLGVSPRQVQSALNSAFGSAQVSTIYTATNQYWVIMEAIPEAQTGPNSLAGLYIRSDSGKLVPLPTIATLQPGVGPLSVNHSGQLPSVTVSFDTQVGVSLSEAVAAVNAAAREALPSSVQGTFAGTAQAFQASQQGLVVLVLLALFVIYIVLGILYESFIHPITILSGLPFAAFGALLALIITRLDLDVYGYVGIVMLIGIVKKNAIMMIDFAVATEREHGTSPTRAIVEAATVRFRPIMMTTAAALMGTLPIAVGWGAAAGSRRPLGVVVVGGLLLSQIITLYVTPVFYTYLDELQGWASRRFGRSVDEPARPSSLPTAQAEPA
jgi:HAE1 family hydrophobic/amphiphilic exporter-1